MRRNLKDARKAADMTQHITQCNNKRTNVLVTYDGETHTVAEWARITGIKYGTLYARLFRRHWDVERALTEEVNGFR